MAVESAADRLAFLNTSEYGESCTVQSAAGASTISAIVQLGYSGDLDIESSAPRALARTSDVATVVHGDWFSTSSKDFIVRGIEDDGTGMTELVLERQGAAS